MNTWTIDIPAADEAAALADLAAATFPLACPPESTASEIADHISSHLTEDHFSIWLADPTSFIVVGRSQGSLAGYVLLCLEPGVEDETAEIRALLTAFPSCELSKCYVRPEFQGSGLASALVDRAFDAARAQGKGGIWVGTNGQNLRAIRFYQKHGFTIMGPRHFDVGGRVHDDYLLEHRLGGDLCESTSTSIRPIPTGPTPSPS